MVIPLRLRVRIITWLCLSNLLAACGGGGSTAPTILPPTSGSADATAIFALTKNISKSALPIIAGYSGTITFAGIAANAALKCTAATTPTPDAVAATAVRRAKSGTADIIYTLSCVSATTIQLVALPNITLYFPAAFQSAGKQFYYAISQPPAAGAASKFRTEGPGNITGGSVEFDATLTPLTLQAGTTYTFVFYGLSNNFPPPQLLYVANAATNSITEYTLPAQGNVAPVRTIAGSQTHLYDPVGIAVDADGNLVVVNALTNGTIEIETFLEGASGNVSPLRTFRTADSYSPGSGSSSAKIALDPFNASIYVALATDIARISVFTPAGIAIRSFTSDSFNSAPPFPPYTEYPIAIWGDLHIDARDEVVVGYSYVDRDQQGGLIEVYAPNVSGTQGALYGAVAPSPYCCSILLTASTYSRSTDTLLGLFDVPVLAAYANVAGTPVLRQYNPNVSSSDTLTAMTADQAGNVFVSDATTNSIFVYSPSGASFSPSSAIAGIKTGLGSMTSTAIGMP